MPTTGAQRGTACDLRLLDAATPDGRRIAIDIAAGHVAALWGPDEPLPAAGQAIDLAGALVLPGLADGHVHLDKCMLGLDWRPHRADASVRAIIAD
ncbi:hypothetical protein [Methylobacterium sp. J-070]|uniref:hypothetical protein n=1 Tax=Methylobacterium sp. J-070 TaxID=2836650 RepID=UPI001FB9AB82|nr:hypothetical protein [Methylobacterium sp. J-070]MCJ2050425.1 hypothetical protein [Methylobacterium sp. J-070]